MSHPDGLPDLFLDRSLGRVQVQAFCLAAGSLRSEEMADRFISNLRAMAEACAEPGPFIYAVHTTRIVRLDVQ